MEPNSRGARRARIFRNSPGAGSIRDITHPLVDGGAITERQARAAARLYDLLNASGGSSVGVVSSYSGRTSGGNDASARGARVASSGIELTHILDGLRAHERQLLNWMMTFSERPTGRRALHYYASEVLGLERPRTSASQIVIGQVQALFESVAELIDGYRGNVQASRPSTHHASAL